jgi:hypothetical protein
MIAYLFEKGKVRKCEYPSYMHLMMSVSKRKLEKMLYYPLDNMYIVRMSSTDPTMLMHSSDPSRNPTSHLPFYETAFVWLQSNACCLDHAYQPLTTRVIRPQPDSGSNWNEHQYGEWADGTMDVFTRFLCIQNNGSINSNKSQETTIDT